MKTEDLIKQLEAQGHVCPPCLQWTLEDIDLRLNAMGHKDMFISDKEKRVLLECFFERIEDELMEYINIKLEKFLEKEAIINPTDEPYYS